MRRLGFITGLMHNALDSSEDLPAFRPERITRADIENWNSGMTSSIREVIRDTRERADDLPRAQADLLRRIDEQETTFLGMVEGLDVLAQEGCYKTRTHGDYHLGQVLQTGDNYVILDFEGEPARTLAERRAKQCPLRDVAGMLRSFDYAAYGALFELWQVQQPEEGERETMEGWALLWEQLVSAAFMDGYHEAISRNTGPRFAPSDPAAFTRVVRIYEIDKAFYELKYEFNNRPAWIPIPVRGLLRALHTEG
jgi:maltose alpha-D-glucosyltransferase/alpha-amylase